MHKHNLLDNLIYADNLNFVEGKIDSPVNTAEIKDNMRRHLDKYRYPIALLYFLVLLITLVIIGIAIWAILNSNDFTLDYVCGLSLLTVVISYLLLILRKVSSALLYLFNPEGTIDRRFKTIIARKVIKSGIVVRNRVHRKNGDISRISFSYKISKINGNGKSNSFGEYFTNSKSVLQTGDVVFILCDDDDMAFLL